ncbi:group I truncated hemoglobin [Mesorhizobium sp. L-8-3]|uniref:group I truncated hemoglobin n=1 Tax=Mesorhizobium sp. L-8-3 TaxID=2744522 RepID=UPI0019261DAB|nr:group 1 truncated hemoglobin [Mesorhizobium sp. L-8-3]
MKGILHMAAGAGFGATLLLTPALAADETLYQRLGGYDAIAAVTDDFLGRLKGDDKLGRFFVGLSDDSAARVRQHVVDLICAETGGPCLYTGRDMKTAHKGMRITKEDWDRTGQLFGETLDKFKVPEQERKDLGGLIAPLEKDIVESGT